MADRKKASKWRRVRVVGGPHGAPYLVPNSKVKRGFSVKQAHWYLPEPLRAVERMDGTWYRLVWQDGKPFYVHQAESPTTTLLRSLFK
jgi:hypothetical protein